MRSARCIVDDTPPADGTRSDNVVSTCCRRLGAESGASCTPPALFCSAERARSVACGTAATSPCTAVDSCEDGCVSTTAAAIAAAAGSATTTARRQVNRRGRAVWSPAATRRTCSRTSAGAVGRAARSSATRSRCDIESLLELLQRAVQARRAVCGRDAEDARGGRRVEVEHDAQRDDLALAGGEDGERRLQIGREPFGEALLEALRDGGELLALRTPALASEVVERDRARHLAEPGPGGAAARVEPVPEPQRALERLACEILGGGTVAREPGEVPVHGVEGRLGCLRERHPGRCTPPCPHPSHPVRR